MATAPIDWAAYPHAVAPLGGGVMSAIFKLTRNPPLPHGEVGTVIVKVLQLEEPGQVGFGEAFLRRMGLATPDDRLVMPGSAEFSQLAGLLGLAPDPNGGFLSNNRPVGALFVMQDLGATGARTIVNQVMGAANRADIDEVFAAMTDPAVMTAVARAMVCDTVIGNFDRITMDGANFGNLMIRRGPGVATQVFLIDTNARLPPLRDETIARIAQQGGPYESEVMRTQLLKGLFDKRAEAISTWIDALPYVISSYQTLREEAGQPRNAVLDQEKDYIAQKVVEAQAIASPVFTAAIDQEVARLVAMMANKADPQRQAVKGAAAATPGQSFKTLKAQVGYLDQRSRAAAGGLPGDIGHEGSASIVETYGRYRLAKATAALPVNGAGAPMAHAALAVPASLRASLWDQVRKGRAFKNQQANDFAAFHPLYMACRADLDAHVAYLKALIPVADNLRQLQASLAEPGSTRNLRAMVPIAKRQVQVQRLRALLTPAIQQAIVWAGQYLAKADQLIGELADVGDRYDVLRNSRVPLQGQRNQLNQRAQALNALRPH